MGKNDPFERLLSKLPSDPPTDDLESRVLRFVRARQRRRTSVQLGAGLVLVLGGLWLSSPLVLNLATSTDFSGSALTVLMDWIRVALEGLQSYINYAWHGLTGLQGNLAGPINAPAWLGLAVISISVLLLLGQLIPQYPGSMDKGLKT
jgi:hypothetical protein